MIAQITSGAPYGINSIDVEIEVDVSPGLPKIVIVGLADTAVQESKERIRSALKSSDIQIPAKRIIISLAPADIKKEGPAFDLPISIGILISMGYIPKEKVPKTTVLLGELALSGEVRAVKGVLPICIGAKEKGAKEILVPTNNAEEASLVQGIRVIPISTLKEAIDHFSLKPLTPKITSWETKKPPPSFYDMSMIKGQHHAKRALIIAASGGHNILLSGPPGSGKTLLSKTIPSILPNLSREEALEVTKIHSIAGTLSSDKPLLTERPFRSPHHTTSRNAIVGGGRWPKPGEVTLAHRGVLFLDEFPEFPSLTLEALRQPLEDREITISRVQGSHRFPADFILVAAMNPCPCGFLGDPDKECTCSPMAIERYTKKLSGPLLDRIDLFVHVPRINFDELRSQKIEATSDTIRTTIEQARETQQKRFQSKKLLNSAMNLKQIKAITPTDPASIELLKKAMISLSLSGRGYHRILKVARTIADIEGEISIRPEHIAEAIQYRIQSR